jgi:hypothetical protein
MISNAYETTLKEALTQGGFETEVLVDSLTLPSGETISINDFEKTGNIGFLLIEGETPRAEYLKFTGIDTTNIKFTGITRGLSFKSNSFTRNDNLVFAHPAGSKVQIVTNTHFLESFVDKNTNETIGGIKTFSNFPVLPNTNPSSLQQAANKKYVDEVVTGAVGSASESIAGTVKLDKPALSASPRVYAVRVHQQATPNMTLYVQPFLLVSPVLVLDFPGGNSPTFTAPSSNPRIDLLVYDSVGSALAIRYGTESASPQIPNPNPRDFVICSVYHRVGETSIKDKDDGTNGYIRKHVENNAFFSTIAYNTQSGTSYTLQLSDVGKVVLMTSNSNNTITVPNDSSVNFSLGSVILIKNGGTATTTLQAAGGVTLDFSDGGSSSLSSKSTALLIKRSTNYWDVI